MNAEKELSDAAQSVLLALSESEFSNLNIKLKIG
jgi:hypothetical protein